LLLGPTDLKYGRYDYRKIEEAKLTAQDRKLFQGTICNNANSGLTDILHAACEVAVLFRRATGHGRKGPQVNI
jgi:hypothetical protein